MRLLEFEQNHVTIDQTISYLRGLNLERVGGNKFYDIAGNQGSIYLIGGGPRAIGFAQHGNILVAAYIWNSFNLLHAPDAKIIIPKGSPETILNNLISVVDGRFNEDDTPNLNVEANTDMFRDRQAEETEQRIDQHATSSMDEQYEELQDKVRLVAGNSSNYIKSLLITGAPSAGKTYNVMKTVQELGLVEGRDYIVVKGSITDAALYLTFIEQIDSLTIFDDCDSVAQSQDGKNMLKNALDTNPVRDISRPTANSLNTKQMSAEDRESVVNAISRILRGEPQDGDIERFEHLLDKKGKKKTNHEDDHFGDVLASFKLDQNGELVSTDRQDSEKLSQLQSYFQRRPPNRIDFKGRIIFISNMEEDDWDSAILTRAFRQDMNFSSDEMLDFIYRIKDSIKAPNLTDAQKLEVLDYIRDLHKANKLKSRINFRLVQQGFDLRLCSTWKRMIANL